MRMLKLCYLPLIWLNATVSFINLIEIIDFEKLNAFHNENSMEGILTYCWKELIFVTT